MGENTKIEWARHTFNPWIGCTNVSPGCDNCYAEAMMDKRLGVVRWGNGERVLTSDKNWNAPRRWNDQARRDGRASVFCASLADVFDNQVPVAWRARLLRLIHDTPYLDWMLLTKRPQNIAKMIDEAMEFVPGIAFPWKAAPWPNVWLGTTVENQQEADRRIPHLLAAPAQIHFLSCEPLLGPVDLTHIKELLGRESYQIFNALDHPDTLNKGRCLQGIDWVICGGESGPGARPMHPDWARSLRDQCATAGVPFHFKQYGAFVPVYESTYSVVPPGFHRFADGQMMHRVGKKVAGRELDGRTHDEFPVPA